MYILSLIIGTVIFLLVLAFHIIIWRVKKPENEIIFLLSLFIIIPFLFFIFVILINFFRNFAGNDVLFSTFLLYFALSCAYIQTYPAARANAPSLQIVYFIYKSGKNGLSEDDIINKFNLDDLVYERIKDLIEEGFVYEDEGRLFFLKKGIILANIYWLYRKIYGIGYGQG